MTPRATPRRRGFPIAARPPRADRPRSRSPDDVHELLPRGRHEVVDPRREIARRLDGEVEELVGPARIGATTNPTRSSRYPWNAGLLKVRSASVMVAVRTRHHLQHTSLPAPAGS